jgi:hypothetical protein
MSTEKAPGGYLDFDLSIWNEGEGYCAKVTDSPAGQSPRCQLPLPSDFKKSEFLLKLENAVLRGSGRFRGPATQGERDLRAFGQGLFDAIFRHSEGIAKLFNSSLEKVTEKPHQFEGLRLKLRIDAPELARLPWEYLYDAGKNDWIALRKRSPIVRFLDLDQPTGELTVNGPINILGMIVNPRGGWDELDVEKERHRIDEALDPLKKTGKVHLGWVPGETSGHLLSMMRSRAWHVFHFIGHGGIAKAGESGDEAGGAEEGFIVLRDEKGDPKEVKASDFKYLLGDTPLRLAVLNCCESGQGSICDPFASPAAALVRHGIPAVVAMQFPISDSAAIRLARGFYESLAASLPIERAITEARLLILQSSNIEWGIPVLYTHSRTGQLFSNVQSKGAPPVQPADARGPGEDSQEAAREYLRQLYKMK